MVTDNNQYKFKEGETHIFEVLGYTEIPDTSDSFFILKNPFGGKQLLKAIHYKHYNIQVNQKIKCKIDKINCSGKIYLEPENPFYKEGEIYDFEVVQLTERTNSVGEFEKVAIVKDKFGIEAVCSLPIHFRFSNEIKDITCKVIRIKKGILFLLHLDKEANINILEIGKNYWFTLTDIIPLENKIEYYILKDEFDNAYSLKKEMYQHFDFKPGSKVECTVTKFHTDGHLKIEPVHPYYSVGKVYSFKYIKTILEKDPLGKEENVIVVEDIYGIETKVRSSDSPISPIIEYLNCKVDGIRKGKAILSLI